MFVKWSNVFGVFIHFILHQQREKEIVPFLEKAVDLETNVGFGNKVEALNLDFTNPNL